MTNAEYYKTKEKAVRAFKKHHYFGESNEMIDWLFEEHIDDDEILDDLDEKDWDELNDRNRLIRELISN